MINKTSLKKTEINRAVSGIHPILEGMNRGVDFAAIYTWASKQNHRFHLIKSKANELNIPIYSVGPAVFSTFGKNHQGLFALLKKNNPIFDSAEELLAASPQTKNKLFLILDGINDPHNLGAISRSAFYFGASGIILPKKGSVGLTDTVHKVSSGASLMLTYALVGSLRLAVCYLKEKGFTIYTSQSSGKGQPLNKINCSNLSAVIMGAEGRGIGKNLLPLTDEKVCITGSVAFDSLNVSVAAGIMLYQFRLQKPL